MLRQSILLVLLTAFTFLQGVLHTPVAHAYALHLPTSIGYYCHGEGLSRPLYANNKCSPRPELNHFSRPNRLEGQLDDLSSNSQAPFSIGSTQSIEEHNLKCTTEHPHLPSPLEVLPLIVSGPSTNRIDLVFFSDGCEFIVIHISLLRVSTFLFFFFFFYSRG